MTRHRILQRLRSINAKLIITFLAALAPLFLVSLQLNRMGADSVMTQVKESMSSRVGYYLDSLQKAVDGISRLQRQYVIDEDIQKLSGIAPSMSPFERAMAQRRVQDKMMLMTISSPYVAESRIYIPMIGKTILSGSDEGEMSPSDVKAAKQAAVTQDKPIARLGDRLVVQYISPNPQIAPEKTSFIMQIDLSREQIMTELAQLSATEGSGAALINRSQSWAVSTMDDDDKGPGRAAVEFVNARFEEGVRSGEERMRLNGRTYLVAFAYSEALRSSLMLTLPESASVGDIGRYRAWLWVLSGLSLLTILLFSSSLYRVIHKPLRSMVSAFRRLERGDMSVRIDMKRQDEFQYLYTQFNITVDRLGSLIGEVYESRIMLQRAELKQLQSQINPHFLYNTYFLVHRMAKAFKTEEVIRATEYLGIYFRHITRSASDEVPLADEYRHIVVFMELQALRYRDRIKAEFDPLPGGLGELSVPRLLLQPMVENVYQHGLKNKLEQGVLRVTVSEETDGTAPSRIVIHIEDNGEELTDAALEALEGSLDGALPDAEITGLLNVHRRIRLRYGEHFGLKLSRSPLGGMRATLAIPAALARAAGKREEEAL